MIVQLRIVLSLTESSVVAVRAIDGVRKGVETPASAIYGILRITSQIQYRVLEIDQGIGEFKAKIRLAVRKFRGHWSLAAVHRIQLRRGALGDARFELSEDCDEILLRVEIALLKIAKSVARGIQCTDWYMV